jgi:hypothetical protein
VADFCPHRLPAARAANRINLGSEFTGKNVGFQLTLVIYFVIFFFSFVDFDAAAKTWRASRKRKGSQ